MKKFIIGFMCVMLLSCHPVYAEIKTQESATFNSAFAYVAMQARQNVVSKEDQLSLAPVPTTQEEAMLKVLLDGIINGTHQFPIYKDQEDEIEITERFSSVIYNICSGVNNGCIWNFYSCIFYWSYRNSCCYEYH